MPFTLSHAVAVIPLFRWKRLDPAALVIGSMVPDAGYFLHRFHLATWSHTFRGSVACALPLAWLFWILCRYFAAFLSRPLPHHQEGWLKDFLAGRSWSRAASLWITLSLLLGIWSHTVLGSFTHDSGWVVRRLDFLHSPWPLYQVLQHIGSLAGMLFLLFVHARWRKGRSPGWTGKHSLLLAAAVPAVLAALPFEFALRHGSKATCSSALSRSVKSSIRSHSSPCSTCSLPLVSKCRRSTPPSARVGKSEFGLCHRPASLCSQVIWAGSSG